MPFAHVEADVHVILQVVRGHRPARPVLRNNDPLPDDFWCLLQACWHKEPMQRPRIQDVAEDISIICSNDFAQPFTCQASSSDKSAISSLPFSSTKLFLGRSERTWTLGSVNLNSMPYSHIHDHFSGRWKAMH